VVGFGCGKVENLGGRMRRMKKRGPNVLYDLNDLLFFLTLHEDLGVALATYIILRSCKTENNSITYGFDAALFALKTTVMV